MRLISKCSLLGVILTVGMLGGCGPRAGGSAAPVPKPAGPLGLSDAREYVLALVNRDRAEAGLDPVERDEVAEKAAQRHVEDMTAHGFTAHWGTDGSVPEQRYTEAGGEHFVQENAACFFDAEDRQLDPDPSFDAKLLEQIESAFMSETPPNDGHKKNIIKPVHNKLGIGLAKPVGIEQPCLAQEFVDAYGSYEAIPREARVRQPLRIAGEVNEPVEFGGVGVGRIEPAKPTPASELNQTSSYHVPEPTNLYFPAGFKTPKPVTVNGRRFSIEVPLDVGGQSGRYEISVWGRYPGGAKNELVMVSLRTMLVR
jgi:uncharacterized protein YkwD